MGAERRVHITLTSRPGRHIVPLGPFFHELPQVFVGHLGQHHARLLAAMGRRRGRLSRLPLAGGWTRYRDLPAPEGPTFRAQWAARQGNRR